MLPETKYQNKAQVQAFYNALLDRTQALAGREIGRGGHWVAFDRTVGHCGYAGEPRRYRPEIANHGVTSPESLPASIARSESHS